MGYIINSCFKSCHKVKKIRLSLPDKLPKNSLLSALYLGSMPRGPLKLNSVLMISLVEPHILRRTLNRELVKGVDFTMSKLLSVLILLCFGRLLVFL